MSDEITASSKKPLAGVFLKSVSPYSKALALHPHLYGAELYNRASELKALDKLVGQLKIVVEETKRKDYQSLRPLLEAIKDALNGNPRLSWWNLITISIGQAFAQDLGEGERNLQELAYLAEISALLTKIIRGYQSTNTKLLLEIRLTALEVDSRLVELEKIPGTMEEPNETLDYLSSEFHLLNRELETLLSAAVGNWGNNLENMLALIKKSNQLLHILDGLMTTNLQAYQQFCKKDHIHSLSSKMTTVLGNSDLTLSAENNLIWDVKNLDEFFALISYFPQISDHIFLSDLAGLLMHAEELFINDSTPQKKRPAIFSSAFLKKLIVQKDAAYSDYVEPIKAAVKAKTAPPPIPDADVDAFKRRLMEENDLHNLCGMLRYKALDFASEAKTPIQIQKDCLLRMRTLIHSSQPRSLDHVLKAFNTEKAATRYYLLQEVILEQFIYCRRHGIF